MLYRIKAGSRERGETLIGEITRLSLFDEDPRSGRLWQAVGSQVTTTQLGHSPKCTSGRMRAGWPEQKTRPQPSGWNTLGP